MPIEIEIVGNEEVVPALEAAFARFTEIDERFSTYKETSEISRMNRGEVSPDAISDEMRVVLNLAEDTREATKGYFDIRHPSGHLDPSGIVKGWAITDVAQRIQDAGHAHFFVNAGGDIAASGTNVSGAPWSVGIRNPFDPDKIVKIVYPKGRGVATSGSYLRGAHIYNPHAPEHELAEVKSITVIGPDALHADRFATAAFAMGRDGITFLEELPGYEGYQIEADGIATMTSGFAAYTTP